MLRCSAKRTNHNKDLKMVRETNQSDQLKLKNQPIKSLRLVALGRTLYTGGRNNNACPPVTVFFSCVHARNRVNLGIPS
jgi:hypothetical protein